MPVATVRRFRADDAAAMVELFRETIRTINIRDDSREQVLAWAPDDIDAGSWVRARAGRFTVVAELDQELVGFGDLAEDGQLDRLYVHARYQRRGIGRAILAALEAESRRRGFDCMYTDASITARPFFAREGFRALREQVVEHNGVEFTNFQMLKGLRPT